jgi:hypothetical protein
MSLSPANFMRKLFTLAVALLAVLAGGCAAVSVLPIAALMGSPNAAALEIHSQTDIRLEAADFIVTKPNVVGESEGFSLLGILTIVPPKFTEAMNRLFIHAEMQPGRPQTLANLIMEKNSSYFILYSLPRISIRADVIEFIPVNATNVPPRPPAIAPPNSNLK